MKYAENDKKTSHDRLIDAVREQWESHGAVAISARQISGITGAPVSSIYHHFGSLEQLFAVAQQCALSDAVAWCDAVWAQFTDLAPSPAAFAGFFAEVVDDWCERQRGLAFAWRECQLLAPANAAMAAAAQQWNDLWQRFWGAAGHRFALGEGALVARRVFENESFLHMIRWRRLVDRAALDDTARTLAAWLCGAPLPEAPWREYAREEALRSMPVLPERDGIAADVVAAAAAIIDGEGLARLTHRAVAERAGLTLGTVSHKFRTKSALLEAAFEGLYRANLERLQSERAGDRSDAADDIAGLIARGARARGSDELFVATARDPALRQFGAQLRYLRGRTSQGTLQRLIGDGRMVTVTESALFSGFLTSQLRASTGEVDEAVRRVRRELAVLQGLAAAIPAG